jgi:WD40 repeat protein
METETWCMSTSPSDRTEAVVVSSDRQGGNPEAVLIGLGENSHKTVRGVLGGGGEAGAGVVGAVRGVCYEPTGAKRQVALVGDTRLSIFDVGTLKRETGVEVGKASTVSWSPHHTHTVAYSAEASIRGVDLRSGKPLFAIENAHGQGVRAVDFNPNRPYYFASGGDDCRVKFWDLRRADGPIKTLSSHSHWVWGVQYNHYHDQLVVSCSSDSVVNLWNVSSISSAAASSSASASASAAAAAAGAAGSGSGSDSGGGAGSDSGRSGKEDKKSADGLVASFDDHESSVYSAAWSYNENDSWIFASLSYDGRVVTSAVPQEEKYKILL